MTPGGIKPPRQAGSSQASTQRIPLPTTGGDSIRKTAVKELLGLPMLGLSFLAAKDQVGQPDTHISPYALDVVTIANYADPLADAVAQMADAYPVLGTLLDRIGTVTPFMALAGVAMAIGTQIAENHGRLPAGMEKASPGLIPREEFARQIRDEAARKNGDG